MESTINYKPSIGKKRFNEAVKEFHFTNSEQFLDFTVNVALLSTHDPKAKKLMAELANVIYKTAPLRFTKPTAQEDKEIRHRFQEMKKGKAVVMHPIR